MHPVSRIEIIAASKEVEKMISVLEQEGGSDYPIIRDVIGKFERNL